MERDLTQLANERFDLLVIGGGVVGACVARDAALRGLRVALIEKQDFAAGTSWNSLKIVHGGLRYLQQLDIGRMRASIRERSMWLRLAPHLVEPLPVLLPTFRHGIQRRPLMAMAFAVNDLISADRNRGAPESRRLPRGRVLSRRECLTLVPELESGDLTGGALFCDAQMYSAERMVLSVLQSAAEAGAVIANYVEFAQPLLRDGRLVGGAARDTLGDHTLDIRSRIVVNAAGPAAPLIAGRLTGRMDAARHDYSVALNVMVPGRDHRVAFAMAGSSEDYQSSSHGVRRQLFFVPWRGHTLIGTGHYPYHGKPEDFQLREDDLERFVDEINRAWPGRVTTDDLELVHSGLLPVASGRSADQVSLLKRHQIIDHARDGDPQAISAISVKFTTARLVAEQTVDLAAKRLGRRVGPRITASRPLPGAPDRPVVDLFSEAKRRHDRIVEPDVLEHLVRFYGEEYESILGYRGALADWDERAVATAPVIRAQWLHALRQEMAQTPEDLVYRRTELGPRGLASESVLASATQFLNDRGVGRQASVQPPV